MIKFMMTFDKDKEARWLTEKANEGWAMKSFCAGFYSFEECEKGKYQYQVDFCDKILSVSKDYKEFMAENDVEIVQQWGFWVILRKETSKGEFQLYTDVDSQIGQYTKILRMFKVVTLIEFLLLLYEVYAASTLGGPLTWGAVFIAMAVVIVLLNATVNTRNIITELKERKTGISENKRTNISALLAIGFMFNACSFIFDGEGQYTIKLLIQIAAIVFMLVGIYDTLKKVKQEKSNTYGK